MKKPVFVLAGQSNAAGLSGDVAAALDDRFGRGNYDLLGIYAGGAPLTRERSSKQDWQDPEELRKDLTAQTVDALRSDDNLVFGGLIWIQGEADTYFSRGANRYGEALEELLGQFRRDVISAFGDGDNGFESAPISILELSNHAPEAAKREHWNKVISEQRAVAAGDPLITTLDPDTVADAAGVSGASMFEDGLHYAQDVGALIAEALIQSLNPTSKRVAPFPATGINTIILEDESATIDLSGTDEIDHVISSISFAMWKVSQSLDHLTLVGNADLSGSGNGRDNIIVGNAGSNQILGGRGNDLISSGAGEDNVSDGNGRDWIELEAGADVVGLTGTRYHSDQMFAFNVSSDMQVGTHVWIALEGLLKIEAVVDGGTEHDVVELSDQGDAFFLHDAYSGFHASLTLSVDSSGQESVARFANIEEIRGLAGNDVIDLTSSDYSLAGILMRIDGGEGDDIIWGSDADETIFGGSGNDTLFGGTGSDVLIGGEGADEFEFTRTSNNSSVSDFSIEDGDALRFYNTGGARFDASSLQMTSNGIRIEFTDLASGRRDDVSISLTTDPAFFDIDLSAMQSVIEIT